jgi:hypothetical protein
MSLPRGGNCQPIAATRRKKTTRFFVSPFCPLTSRGAAHASFEKLAFLGGNAEKRDLLKLQGKTHQVFVTIASHWQQWQRVPKGVAMVAILESTRENPSI